MKLTVGRIVHAYRYCDGQENSGPFAAIVVGLGTGSAALRVLSHLDTDLDHTTLVQPEEGALYRVPGTSMGWFWRWPPREVDVVTAPKPTDKTEHERGCAGLCRGCCP